MVEIRFDAEITGKGFVQDLRAGRMVHRHVVFKAVTADPRQQVFQVGHLNYRAAADGIERIVNRLPGADIGFDSPLRSSVLKRK